ncbi:MAG: RecQ family zinc-binding domain-containing protein, partial [Balneolaceae bacterium]|nr:RecQ family zinc-binding domain-containing protein [Balneolaceae bacterium]
MSGYADTKKCREVYLRTYFGESSAKPCGHCDNCISVSETGSDKPVTDSDIELVEMLLKEAPRSPQQVRKETRWKAEKVKKVIHFMEREQIISRSKENGTEYKLGG